MANYGEKYTDIEKKVLSDNYGLDINKYLSLQKLELELLESYIINNQDKNESYLLLQEIIAINMIISKKLYNVKRK